MSVAVANSNEADGSEPRSHDPRVFVLNRELSEVHLLLDNLSANPDKSFKLLAVDNSSGLPKTWLDDVCRISWPPKDATPEAAAQAALLIRAKDRLNILARPASGATIAFTLLVSQEEVAVAKRERGVSAPTRRSLACDAYPGLVAKAETFRWFMRAMGWGLLVILLLTCGLSWYVAYGASTVAQATSVQAALAAAEKRISDSEAPVNDKAAEDTVTPLAGKAVVAYCDRPKLLPAWTGPAEVVRYESVSQMQACQARDHVERQVRSVNYLLRRWMDPKSFFVPRQPVAQRAKRPIDSGALQETLVYAQSILHILASSVLPVFYGVLGAAAAALRSLSPQDRVQNTLPPRDLLLSWQQLALGAVMGACIGLLCRPAERRRRRLAGAFWSSVALSSSALSFVAGFGVDQVFTALEALMGRIFAVVQPTTPATPVRPS